MKKLIYLLSFTVMFAASTQAQTLSGSYVEMARLEKLTFNGDSVQFNLSTGGCLIYQFRGKGTYQIVKNRLFIKPLIEPIHAQFKTETTPGQSSDSVYFRITDSVKHPIIGASIFIASKHNQWGAITDRNGLAKLPRSKFMPQDSIKIGYIGYYTVNLKPDTLNDYNITMLLSKYDAGYYNKYLSNKGEGYPIKATANGFKINFKPSGCGGANAWLEFKRTDALSALNKN